MNPFPAVGPLMAEAFADLRFVEQSNELSLDHALGSVNDLPRPWLLESCSSPDLRAEVWTWLDEVVDWFNGEYAWLTDDEIPGCWPLHPHLVHELGVVADQRRRATESLTSDLVEEWHRYCLPAFHERLRSRLCGCCEIGHTGPPAGARIARYRSAAERERRAGWYDADLRAVSSSSSGSVSRPRRAPRLVVSDGFVVDPRTGEIT